MTLKIGFFDINNVAMISKHADNTLSIFASDVLPTFLKHKNKDNDRFYVPLENKTNTHLQA